MLARLIEHSLAHAINHSRSGLSALARRHQRPAQPPSHHVVLGQTIPCLSHEIAQFVSLSPEERRRHMYLIGATGTGKTNLILRLIESDIVQRRSFCVIDLRGDLVDRILLRLAATETPESLGRRLLLVDLRHQDQIVGFNPLIGHGDTYSRAMHLLEVVSRQSPSWGVQLEETLRNALIALAESGWSLLEIEPLLSNRAFRAEVIKRLSDPYVKSFFQRYDLLSDDKQMSWRLPVLNKVTPLLSIPILRLMFGQRTSFSFSDLFDRQAGTIVLVSLAVDRLHQAAHLVGGLLVSSFQSAIMARTDQPERLRQQTHLYVDEFETMATERFEAIVSEGRRFGLGLCLSHQNLSQVPNNLRQVIRNNVHTQVFFQTGALDAAELATEIASAERREAVRAALMSQGVGEAFLVQRAKPSRRVRVFHSVDPAAELAAVTAIRTAAFQAHARPRLDLERELAQREAYLQSLVQAQAASTAAPGYEIRHTKKPGRFNPNDA